MGSEQFRMIANGVVESDSVERTPPIIDALVKGQATLAVLALLADGRIRATAEELTAALHGRVTSHHGLQA